MSEPTPESPSPAKRYSAWACVAVNQLAFPGLGTIMAGHRFGMAQASLMVVGFLLVLVYFAWFFYGLVQFIQNGNEAAWHQHMRRYAWAGISGLILSLLSWGWALISSIQILREPQPSPAPPSGAPPIVAAPPQAPASGAPEKKD